jgi:hypothetical protein
MVLKVTKSAIEARRAIVSDYTWTPSDPTYMAASYDRPKYWTWEVDDDGNQVATGNPYAQLDPNADTIPENLWNT